HALHKPVHKRRLQVTRMLAADSALRIVGVEKQFDTQQGPIRALARTDFTVRKGEFAVLLGPSGCGKKTMLRLVAGLVRRRRDQRAPALAGRAARRQRRRAYGDCLPGTEPVSVAVD